MVTNTSWLYAIMIQYVVKARSSNVGAYNGWEILHICQVMHGFQCVTPASAECHCSMCLALTPHIIVCRKH